MKHLIALLGIMVLTGSAPLNAQDWLDSTFAGTGHLRVDLQPVASDDEGQQMILLPDGRILVASNSDTEPGYQKVALTRYLPDGTIDPDFGTNGIRLLGSSNNTLSVLRLFRTASGRLLVVCMEEYGRGLVWALQESGASDTSYGTLGRVYIDVPSVYFEFLDADVSPLGELVLAGRYSNVYDSYLLARITASGVLDPSFGQGGIALPPGATAFTYPSLVRILADGKLLCLHPGNPAGFMRFLPNGAVDASFGTSGLFQHPFCRQVKDILLEANGGFTLVQSTGEVWRLLPDLTADLSFGVNGLRDIDAFQANVRIIRDAAGGYLTSGHNTYSFGVAQLSAAGDLDPSFGIDGVILIDCALANWSDRAIAKQPDGKILMVGRHRIGFDYDLSIYRLKQSLILAVPNRVGSPEALALWPNPAAGSAVVALPDQPPYGTISLRDASGRQVRSMKANTTHFTIDLDAIAPGLYLVEYLNRGTRAVGRLVVQ